MEHSKQVEIVSELLQHISTGSTARVARVRTNDATHYTSPERLDLERERIFGAHPLVACLSADIPDAGSFVTQDIVGVPVIIVRDGDGQARAFLNACRHRGTRLVTEACGRRQRFSCPFHAWTYDTQGRLTGVPRRNSFGEFDRTNSGLIDFPVVERYGLIWLSVRPDLKFDIEDHLCGLGTELASWDLGCCFPRYFTSDLPVYFGHTRR